MKFKRVVHEKSNIDGSSASAKAIAQAPTIKLANVSGNNAKLRQAKVGSAIDQVGTLTAARDLLDARIEEAQSSLMDLLKTSTQPSIEGKKFVASKTPVSCKQLLPKAKVMTSMIALLQKANEQNKNDGGLFEMILSLDPDIINAHFLPLLEAIFEKSALTEEAEKLYFVSEKDEVVISLREAV